MLNQACIPRINPTSLRYIIPFLYATKFVLLRFCQRFCDYLQKGYWSVVLFFCEVLFSLVLVSVILALWNELGSVPYTSTFGGKLS